MNEYHEILGRIPDYLIKYLDVDSLKRLKKICYFCGMDYASKNVYNFKYNISRFDHSLSTALLVSKFTCDKNAILSALFHDISTPVFSHVIDYMNNDYEKQESTEEKTEEVIYSDKKLLELFRNDNININNIIEYKKYSIVDLERPKLCADRIDGIILSSLSWVKNIDMKDVKKIVKSLELFVNENKQIEIGASIEIAKKLVELEQEIDDFCHSDYDNYMMNLLATLTKFAIDNNVIKYDDLYSLNEDEIFEIFNDISNMDIRFNSLYYLFKNIKKESIKLDNFPQTKKRVINPLIGNGTRLY